MNDTDPSMTHVLRFAIAAWPYYVKRITEPLRMYSIKCLGRVLDNLKLKFTINKPGCGMTSHPSVLQTT